MGSSEAVIVWRVITVRFCIHAISDKAQYDLGWLGLDS